MTRVAALLGFCLACCVSTGRLLAAEVATPRWTAATWNGERAFAAASGEWDAIVSVDRGRLVHLGKRHGGPNALFAPATRDDPAGWGGHRVWLGPQSAWSAGWPPPTAWEASAADRVEGQNDRLELTMPNSGEGWGRLKRIYFWRGEKLHCVVRMEPGTRAAQIIQIVQVPPAAEVRVSGEPRAELPRGYVQLHLGRPGSPIRVFPDPAQVTRDARGLRLRYTGATEKLGFSPQALAAQIGGLELIVERGAAHGASDGTPDEGFVTQVFLGSPAVPLVELEQLSPRWRVGETATFEMVLTLKDVSLRSP